MVKDCDVHFLAPLVVEVARKSLLYLWILMIIIVQYDSTVKNTVQALKQPSADAVTENVHKI